MPVTITSTTDTPEAVTAATGAAVPKEIAVEKPKPALKSDNDSSETDDASGALDKEDQDEAESESDTESEEVEPRPKKKNGFKKRIDKLNKNLSQKQQEADYWRNEALKSQKPSQDQKPDDKKADTLKKPKSDDFEKHEDYVEALTDWKMEQKDKEREQLQKEAAVKSHHEKQMSDHRSRLKDFVKSHSDFEDVIADVDDIRISPTVQEVILASDSGPELMYELAKNRDEYARINALSPIAAARELGRIEAKLSVSSSDEPVQSKLKPKPKPLAPVGSSSATSTKSPDEMDYQEYKAWWAKTHKR